MYRIYFAPSLCFFLFCAKYESWPRRGFFLFFCSFLFFFSRERERSIRNNSICSHYICNMSEGGCPHNPAPVASPESTSGCPHNGDKKTELNPRNNIPLLKQRPWPGQSRPLDTNRVTSSIPKGDFTPSHQEGGGKSSSNTGNWVYPSHQQFFNAMKLKGWDTKEEDIEMVVAIHNAVNEKTWQDVCEWERVCTSNETPPKLLKFKGRPKDLSPRARFKMLMGSVAPFDRHDWYVQRDDGTEVRYVIDFYRGRAGDEVEGASPFHGNKSIYLDVRPALDAPRAFFDRFRMAARSWFGSN